VDDYVFRKTESYGTIRIDLEKRKPIRLLPDRDGKTLEAWLLAYPGVAIVSRDHSLCMTMPSAGLSLMLYR
jgi:transposase